MSSSDCSLAGSDGDAPVMKEKSLSVPNRLRLLVRPKLTADIRERSSAMCAAGTPTRASIWHTTSGNTEGNLLASRIGMRIGRRDRSLMKIKAWRRPIRSVLPYQSPRRVVDSTGGRSSTFFSRARSCRVQRSTITLMSVPRPMQPRLTLEAAGTQTFRLHYFLQVFTRTRTVSHAAGRRRAQVPPPPKNWQRARCPAASNMLPKFRGFAMTNFRHSLKS